MDATKQNDEFEKHLADARGERVEYVQQVEQLLGEIGMLCEPDAPLTSDNAYARFAEAMDLVQGGLARLMDDGWLLRSLVDVDFGISLRDVANQLEMFIHCIEKIARESKLTDEDRGDRNRAVEFVRQLVDMVTMIKRTAKLAEKVSL